MPSKLTPPQPYQLERPLGSGATSNVWVATTGSGEAIALKVGRSGVERARLADEAERLVLVDSDWLPRMVDAGTTPEKLTGVHGGQVEAGMPYLALEWIDGTPLGESYPAERGERITLALRVARDVGRALADLHAANVGHGDIKPANILVSQREGEPRCTVVDLGLAGDADAAPTGGTIRYLAPELGQAGTATRRACDLWALGRVLLETAHVEARTSPDPALESHPDLPPELAAIVRGLLAPAPGARPDAEWVWRTASAALGMGIEASTSVRPAIDRVRRSYLATRRAELRAIARGATPRITVGGLAEKWLADPVNRLARVAHLRGAIAPREPLAIADLDVMGRARWLVDFVGPSAAGWPPLGVESDAELANRLAERAANLDPRALTYSDLSHESPRQPQPIDLSDPVGIALRVARTPNPQVLDAAEHLVLSHRAPASLALAVARALRLRGELGRALLALQTAETVEASIEAAECARRARDATGAAAWLDRLDWPRLAPRSSAMARALLARLELDAGHADTAKARLKGSERIPAVCEVEALAELAAGRLTAAKQAAAEGLAAAEDDEQQSRLEAVSGNVAHALGEPEQALQHFRRAADHAVRAGAVVEEATYLTGVAATSFDVGRLDAALDASARAALLFEHLGRTADAGRALLTRAAVFAAVGATEPARAAALEAISRARRAGDTRCRVYAHLALADVLPMDSLEGLEHVERAEALLDEGAASDRLRVAARRYLRTADGDVAALDAVAERTETAPAARLEWWGARARIAARAPQPLRAEHILSKLGALAGIAGPLPARGCAFAAARDLAQRTGNGDAARRFARDSAEAARALGRHVPPALRAALSEVDWILTAHAPVEASVTPEQLNDVETLVRALGTRDRLRPLLDQILDALVLWTGVERGLLLVRAPGGKLVPRAARNLARSDLKGAQLQLSSTLAERALETGEPVVAVDAAGELPEVHQSVHALNLRSVLAVPLLARGEVLGVVYLDDRVRRGAFGPPELAWVRLVATLAAVAVADARDQIRLRRVARRAERAEARLARSLAKREAELDVARSELAARDERATRYPYGRIVGDSEPLCAMLEIVDRVTPSEVPVLITGESGSGKELVARAIHDNGPRQGQSFVTENCSAIPEGLLESTLFGHTRGAFTGASRPRAGLFEVADGGTLFLDEIGEMSLVMQTKLLRVLQDGEIRPVGSERARRVDVRVIAATHRDLSKMVEAGSFRKDLFYRLSVIAVAVPPLRDRPGDVALLVRHFTDKHAPGRRVRVSRAALDTLKAYTWPGNVRQLENEVRRALVLADDTILPEHLSPDVLDPSNAEAGRDDGLNLRRRVDALETELVRAALARTEGNQTRAAEVLGLSRFGLQKMMKRLGIQATPGQGRAAAVTDVG